MKGACRHEVSDSSEWARWLEQYAPGLLLFARQQARSEADAQDLVQDALVECWQRAGAGGPPPPAMVFAAIRRRAVDLARREDRRGRREAAAHVAAPQCWFDSAVEDRERNQVIQQAMERLPELNREAVTLKIWGGLTFAEIAEVTGIPPNTAASRYRYGLEELRRLTTEVFA